MIMLGENTEGLIASELLKPSREQITVFCGVPQKEMAALFRKTEQVPAFQDFSKSTYLRPYCRKNYEIERKGILEGYREVIPRHSRSRREPGFGFTLFRNAHR